MCKFSRVTVFIGLFIIISASFLRQVMDFLRLHIGESGLIILIGLILTSGGLVFLVFNLKHLRSVRGLLTLVSILTLGLILAWQMKIPQERIHILEYGVLGWFASRDLHIRNKTIKDITPAIGIVLIVGIIDEVFQAILPYRVGDLRDVLFNGLGGIWGTTLYLAASKFQKR